MVNIYCSKGLIFIYYMYKYIILTFITLILYSHYTLTSFI